MTSASEIAELTCIVAIVFGSLVVALKWTRYFADWLWLVPRSPKIIIFITISAMLLAGVAIRIVTHIPLNDPLAVSVELVFMPFLVVKSANYGAFRLAWWRSGTRPQTPWRTYIFDARRQSLRETYEAPPTEQLGE